MLTDSFDANSFASDVAGDLLDGFHDIQARRGGQAAVSVALACAMASMGFVLDGTGKGATDGLLAMLRGAAERRQDRPAPVREQLR